MFNQESPVQTGKGVSDKEREEPEKENTPPPTLPPPPPPSPKKNTFECPTCGKAFSTRGNRSRHKKTHEKKNQEPQMFLL